MRSRLSSCADLRRDASPIAPTRGMTLIEMLVTVLIVAVAASMATAAYGAYRTRSQESSAANDIVAIQTAVQKYFVERSVLPATLADVGPGIAAMMDPWGHGYQYVNHANAAANGLFREDGNIVPINSDFDLYSMGEDGASAAPLTDAASRDDIVRANNGRFVGRASVYGP